MPSRNSIDHVTGTAYWIAAARARETARPDRLFNDPYAAELAGERGRLMLEQRERPTGKENSFLPIRTRYFDDVITTRRPPQVVLLGAGLDTRAFRLPLDAGTRVFEVDHPEILEEKEAVLSRLRARPRCRREIVRADLADSWAGALREAGFEPESPALWLAEGLFFYLAGDLVRDLVGQAFELSAPGSAFAADVFGTGLLRLPGMEAGTRWRTDNGMPPPFCTDRPEELFTEAGWDRPDLTPVGAANASYGRIPRLPAPARAADPTLRTYLVTAGTGAGRA